MSDLFGKYFAACGTKSSAKKYGNVIHPSIIDVDDSTPVTTIVPPPELHLLLGLVNHLWLGLIAMIGLNHAL